MMTRRGSSTHRSSIPCVQLLGLMGLLLLTSANSANAISIEFQIPAQSTVDIGGAAFFGVYQDVAPRFSLTVDSVSGDVYSLILKNFYIPNPVAAFAEYEFLIEDPDNPSTYAPMQDIPLTWDTMFDTGGGIVGRIEGQVRTRLNFTPSGGTVQSSDFILTLTTDPTQTGVIFCPGGNFNLGRVGSDLPAGFEAAAGASLTFVAGTCPDINAPTNDLSNTIVALSIPGVFSLVPEPGTGLLLALGLVCLAAVSSRLRI